MPTLKPPRLQIAALPTPVHRLPRLSEALGGPEIWIKRDDLTGLAFGGNKTRKLEYLLAAAREAQAKRVLTRGAIQSNHCRQTAAAAARHGFACTLVLEGEPPSAPTGNVLLDELLGANIVWTRGEDPEAKLLETKEELIRAGEKPYLIPYGGSNELGVYAYSVAMTEYLGQGTPADRVLFASSSGGTQAGLVLGARMQGFEGRITGISVHRERGFLRGHVTGLVNSTVEWLGMAFEISGEEIEVVDDYLGGGYAVVGDLERDAIRLCARREGLIVDPVYTGRAMGGMIDMIKRGVIGKDERVLFWHTGGTPALFAYGDRLTD
jgi:D-cysteine desulfhydrase family pyridoxal phosphate-dependent enzyme